MYADFMAFPFPQHVLMRKDTGLVAHPVLREFAYLQATSVPPFITEFGMALAEHRRFSVLVAEAQITARVEYGLQNPPEDLDDATVRILSNEGVSYMALSYFKENKYGGGFHTPDAPLTDFGKQLISWMNSAGMTLDLSHAGHRTAREAMKYVDVHEPLLKVVATHSACHGVYSHLRNLPDDVLVGITQRGGIIGLPTVSWLLDDKDNSLEPFFAHLAYIVDLVGEANVAIGSDGVYAEANEAEDNARFAMMSAKLDPDGTIFGARLPEECPLIHSPNRMEMLFAMLADRFSPSIAEKVTSTNLLAYVG